jgi:hypothetical protein
MTPSNTALYTTEPSYLQYLMSTGVKDPKDLAPLLTIEKFTSYMDVQKPFLTWWLPRSTASIPMKSQLLFLWNIITISLNWIPGKRSECSLHFLSFAMSSLIWKLLETTATVP